MKLFRFSLFSECQKLAHAVFTRHGGFSSAPYHSLNFGYATDDEKKNVTKNHRKGLEALDLTVGACCKQIHGNHVTFANPHLFPEADGLLTDIKKLALIIKHADCQAAIFYDPVRHALANIHCGWRGNVKNIYKNTVEAMRIHFGSRPENLLVAISPSLGPDASEFVNYKNEFPKELHCFAVKPNFFDLWQFSYWQLTELKILPHHIEIARICTYSNPQDYFSHRRDKITGRNATFAALL